MLGIQEIETFSTSAGEHTVVATVPYGRLASDGGGIETSAYSGETGGKVTRDVILEILCFKEL